MRVIKTYAEFESRVLENSDLALVYFTVAEADADADKA